MQLAINVLHSPASPQQPPLTECYTITIQIIRLPVVLFWVVFLLHLCHINDTPLQGRRTPYGRPTESMDGQPLIVGATHQLIAQSATGSTSLQWLK